MDKEKRIAQFLDEYDAPNNLGKNFERLGIIYDVIHSMMERHEQAEVTLKETVISVKNVARECEWSNKTFYNNPILKAFVDSFIGDDDNEEQPLKLVKEEITKEKYDELSAELSKMVVRDITTEKLKIELEQLQKENERLVKLNQDLEAKYEKAIASNPGNGIFETFTYKN